MRDKRKMNSSSTNKKDNPNKDGAEESKVDEDKMRAFLLKQIGMETQELETQSLKVSEELAESTKLFRQLKRAVVTQYYSSSRHNTRLHPAIEQANAELAEVGSDSSPTIDLWEGESLVARKSKRQKTSLTHRISGEENKIRTLKLRFYVGTMCKYLSNDFIEVNSTIATHKWTVYLRNCDSNVESISKHFFRVTFVLHDSYKPNNMVRVSKEPFKVTREGWGEFIMKIKVTFVKRNLNNPIELVHPVNFLHVKSLIPIITLETPIDITIKTDELNEVIYAQELTEAENNQTQHFDTPGQTTETEEDLDLPNISKVLEYLDDTEMGFVEDLLERSDENVDIDFGENKTKAKPQLSTPSVTFPYSTDTPSCSYQYYPGDPGISTSYQQMEQGQEGEFQNVVEEPVTVMFKQEIVEPIFIEEEVVYEDDLVG